MSQQLESVELHIAVTGDSGAGKSTFINSMRGLWRNDEGAAATGNKETTMKPTEYFHSGLKNVYFCDMPGIGTTAFPAKEYLKKMNFEIYDFFIIISNTRFTENDTMLAKEIKKLGKNFYFVRSKVDNDLEAFEKEGIDYHKDAELETTRKDCDINLEKVGIQSQTVLLISSFNQNQFDFPDLKKSLVNVLPDMKKDILILSFSNISKESIEEKRKILTKKIWTTTVIAGVVGAVPIPGLSFPCNIDLLFTTIIYFRSCLFLDSASLTRLARRVGKPVKHLRAVIKTQLVGEINKDFIVKSMLGTSAPSTLEFILDFIPLIGSIYGAASSFTMTYKLLNDARDDLVNNAKRMVNVANETNDS